MEREERSILQAEVEGAGGTWLPALTPETLPLAVTCPEGSKYDAALKAGIKVVSLRWCWACVEERSHVELDVYPLQADDEVPPFRSGWRGGWLEAAAPAPAPVSDAVSAGVRRAGLAHQSHSEAGATSTREAQLPRGAPAASSTGADPAASGTGADPADLVTIDIDSETAQGRYLDSCYIHPLGFEKAQMRDVVKLIRRGGATRQVRPDNNVTHIVASVRAQVDGLAYLRAKVVTVSWLVESCKAGRVVDTDSHEITKQQTRRPSTLATSATTQRPSPVNLDGGSSLSTIFAGSRSSMMPKHSADAIVEETRHSGKTSPRQGHHREPSGSVPSGRPRTTKSRHAPNNQLSGKRFTLSHALTEAEAQKARKLVVDFGGTISQSPADGLGSQSTDQGSIIYSICPHGQSTNTFSLPAFASPGHSSSSNSRANVTLEWVKDCCHALMKKGKHADPSVCPAFTPLPFKLPLPNAHECVVCVSGFMGMDRKRIQALLKLVGAKVNERLSKINTTMLVSLKPEGAKYKSAVQWRVPIVTVDWLYKSVSEGRLENPEAGTDLVANHTTTSATPAKEEKQAELKDGHLVSDRSSTAGVTGGLESNVAPTDSSPKIQTKNGNPGGSTSAPRVDAAQDPITTEPPRTQHGCEDLIIEQAEPSSQATKSNETFDRRVVRGSQPLPLQHSASVSAPLPASQRLSVAAGQSTECNGRADRSETDAEERGDRDPKHEHPGAEQDQRATDVSNQVSVDLNRHSTMHELPDDEDFGSGPEKQKPTSSEAAVRSDCLQVQPDQNHSPTQHLDPMKRQQHDAILSEDSEPRKLAPHQKPAAHDSALDAASQSPRHDASRSLKRSLSDSQVTDSGGKENLKNVCADEVPHSATAPEIRSEPMCSASASDTKLQKPDLSLLVKDFKRKFQKKAETPREHTLLPPAPAHGGPEDSFGHSTNEVRRVTRSEVERDTTDRPGDSVNETGKRSRLNVDSDGSVPSTGAASKRVSRRHRVEAATASEIQKSLTARKVRQQSLSTVASAALAHTSGNSDDEDMYAESQMVVYDRSSGTSAPGSSSNISMPPPPKQQKLLPNGPKSSPESSPKSNPNARPTRRSTRRESSGGDDVIKQRGATAASAAPASPVAEPTKSKATDPRVFMISGLKQQQKRSVMQDIKRLGGTVSVKNSWDPRCTHLITDEVKRVEKTLAACASGRWVVTLDYVKASLRAKRFVDEEQYEHRGPEGQRDEAATEHRSNELRPDTPHRCRVLQETVPALNGGLFSGMKALVTLAEESKRQIVVNVLKSGGAAQVITCTGAPTMVQLKAATAIFVDPGQVKRMEKHATSTDARVYTSDTLAGLLSHGHFDTEDRLYKLN